MEIMAMIIIAIVILFLFIAHKYINDALSRFCAYSFLLYWGVSLAITCFQPLGMAPILSETHLLLLEGMTGFFIGFLVTPRLFKGKISYKESNKNLILIVQRLLTSWQFGAVYIICTLFLFKYAKNALIMAQLNGGTIEYEDRLDLVFDGSGLAQNFMEYIVTPLAFVTYILIGFAIVYGKRKYWLFYVCSPIFLIGFLIISGGRSVFVILMMELLICLIALYASKTKLNIPSKYIRWGIPLVIVMFIGMSVQTGYRKTGEYQLDGDSLSEATGKMAESFFTYSVIPVKMMDMALRYNWPERYGTMNYGKATFAGTDYIACRVAKRFLGREPRSGMEIVHELQEIHLSILPGHKMGYNYCYTAVFYNYLDGGVIGVFIFPFFFGLIYRYFIIRYQQYKNLPYLILVCFGYFMMLMALFNGYFIKTWVVLFCIVVAMWGSWLRSGSLLRLFVAFYKRAYVRSLRRRDA